MKYRWNALLYLGFLVVLLSFPSYFLFFARFPVTRDFPWVNLFLFALGLGLLGAGLLRVYKKPDQYRGKILGPIFSLLSIAIIALFVFFTFSFAKRLPASKGAPQVGQKAPDFTLPDKDGNPVTLSKLWGTSVANPATGHADQWVLLIFYRGYW
jgi:hypothetical protein